MYQNLKLHMWKRGMRQNRLAKMLDVDEALLSKIVNGFREPSADLRRRIALVLDGDADWLFQHEDGAGAVRAANSPAEEPKP
jgi:transcriptional regulator with XRE-family HTH domain